MQAITLFDPGSSVFYSIYFSSTWGTATLSNTLTIQGSVGSSRTSNTIAGTIDFTGDNLQPVNGVSTWGFSGATFNIDKSGSKVYLIDSNGRLANLTVAAGSVFDLNGYNFTVQGGFTNNGTLQLQGGEGGTAPTINDGSTIEYTATTGSRNIKDWSYKDLKINSSTGAAVYTVPALADSDIAGDLTVVSGELDVSDQPLSIDGSLTITGGTLRTGTAVVTVGDGTGTDLATVSGGEFIIESDDIAGGDLVINATWSNTGGTIEYADDYNAGMFNTTLAPYYGLKLNSALETFTPTATLDLGGVLTIAAGTLDMNANNKSSLRCRRRHDHRRLDQVRRRHQHF